MAPLPKAHISNQTIIRSGDLDAGWRSHRYLRRLARLLKRRRIEPVAVRGRSSRRCTASLTTSGTSTRPTTTGRFPDAPIRVLPVAGDRCQRIDGYRHGVGQTGRRLSQGLRTLQTAWCELRAGHRPGHGRDRHGIYFAAFSSHFRLAGVETNMDNLPVLSLTAYARWLERLISLGVRRIELEQARL